jgi:hypothetical protein
MKPELNLARRPPKANDVFRQLVVMKGERGPQSPRGETLVQENFRRGEMARRKVMSATRLVGERGSIRGYRSQDVANLILAVWLFISPWALQFGAYAGNGGASGAPAAGPIINYGSATWDAWVLGVIIFLVSISALSEMALWQEWINLVLGVWLFIAPWALGFNSGMPRAAWDHWVVGILVAAFALAGLATPRKEPPTPVTATSADLAHAGQKPVDRTIR